MTKTVEMRIRHLRPCIDAAVWAKEYTSPAKAWQECQRGDWMLWLLGKLGGESKGAKRKKLVLCCCECARVALPIYEKRYPKDNRVRKCLEITEAWAVGKATIKEVEAAAAAIDDNTVICSTVAYAASAAAAAAVDTAYVATAIDAAAYVAAVFTPRTWTKQCADIVRKHYPKPPRIRRTDSNA